MVFFGTGSQRTTAPREEAAFRSVDQRPGTVYLLARASTRASAAALPAQRGKWVQNAGIVAGPRVLEAHDDEPVEVRSKEAPRHLCSSPPAFGET
jgi:hypothetical protein